jgi:hypothetical protein
MTDEQIRIAVALRLGAPTCEEHTCVCGKDVDKTGTHGLSCRRSAGRQSRHGHVNAIIQRALTSACIPARLEPAGLCRSDGKRVDGVTLVPWARGCALTWDATVVDPLAPSRITSAATRPGTTAEDAEQKKRRKYDELTHRGYMFEPVAFETLGRPGPSTPLSQTAWGSY